MGQIIQFVKPEFVSGFGRIPLRSLGHSPVFGSTVTTRQPWCPGDTKKDSPTKPHFGVTSAEVVKIFAQVNTGVSRFCQRK